MHDEDEFEDIIHLIPDDDLYEHEPSMDCWCEPEVEEDDDGEDIILHKSADGREGYITGQRKTH